METKSGDSKGVEELSGKLIENATGIQSQKQTGLPPPSTPVSDPDEDDLDDLDGQSIYQDIHSVLMSFCRYAR